MRLDNANLVIESLDKAQGDLGNGLEEWLRRAPGFNVDKIVAPLRLEVDGLSYYWTISYWETFSRLKVLNPPVELYVVPESNYGNHQVQIPAQRLASGEATVDWMEFWLNGNED